jgi:hypothetical protein
VLVFVNKQANYLKRREKRAPQPVDNLGEEKRFSTALKEVRKSWYKLPRGFQQVINVKKRLI